jgi:tetratricopeptide (TPR) repeat protein
MKQAIIVFSSCILINVSFGQSLKQAITKTMNERYEEASAEFHQLIRTTPGNADLFFYAGDNYLYWGELDSAFTMFSKGEDAAPQNPLNFAGHGRILWMKGDEASALAKFARATELVEAKGSTLEKGVKETTYLKMAESLVLNPKKNLDLAFQYLNKALSLSTNKRGEVQVTNPELYILMGDYYAEKDGFNLSNALAQYTKAFELDPNYTRTLLREGQLYVKVRNWDEGLNYFNQAIAADGSFAPAYREKAELLYRAGRFNPAIESYEKYLQLNNSCRVQQRYASFIYLTKDYKRAAEQLEKAMPCNPDNVVMHRLLGYAYYEIGDYTKGMESIERYFKLAEAKDRTIIVGTDLAYKGKLLSKLGQDSAGIELIRQGMSMDTSYKDGFGEIATIYSKAKNYPKAAEWYDLKIANAAEKNPLDYYYLGQSRYFAKDYALADQAFAVASEKYPDAWFWRAKSNHKLDNQDAPTGLAKPFFETAIRKVGADPKAIESNKKSLIEAYSYLGLLYGKQDNYACSKAAWLKVAELDPANKTAADVMKDKNLQSATGDCELVPAQ